jgi:opacity protein-like surface antigen
MVAFFTALASACAVAQDESEAETDPLKERLGVRIGYARTSNDLSDAFGAGLNLALHFTQRIKRPFSVDVTMGAIYLGSTDKDVQFPDFDTAWYDQVSMRILTITAAPMVEFEMSDRTSYYISAGGGLYSASLLLDQALSELDLTKNYFGVTAGAGLTRRIFTNWFLDLNFHLHKFWTPDEPTSVDWIYVFSDGDSDPLYWAVTTGVALRLF